MWGGQDPHQRILMGPPGDSPRSGYEFQLVSRGQGEVARFYMTQSGGEYPSLGMDPRGFRAIVGPSEKQLSIFLNFANFQRSNKRRLYKEKKENAHN